MPWNCLTPIISVPNCLKLFQQFDSHLKNEPRALLGVYSRQCCWDSTPNQDKQRDGCFLVNKFGR